jgi:hypothetical protein
VGSVPDALLLRANLDQELIKKVLPKAFGFTAKRKEGCSLPELEEAKASGSNLQTLGSNTRTCLWQGWNGQAKPSK